MKMSKRWMVALLALCLTGTVACDNKKEDDGGGDSKAEAQETQEGDGDKEGAEGDGGGEGAAAAIEGLDAMRTQAEGLLKEGKPLNEKQYEALMLGLKDCEVDQKRGYIDSKCEAYKTLKKARANRTDTIKNISGMWSGLGQKHIGHESEAVRIYAAQLMGSLFGANKDAQSKILDAARKEESPAVLMAMVRTVRSSAGKNPEVAKLLMELSKHENEHVREAVIVGLTSSWSEGAEGTLERAIEMVEGDESMDVRKAGCSNLGQRADEKALPTLKKYTAWPPKEKELYSDCFRGLVGMWSSPVPHKNPNEGAYTYTLELLKEKPRSKERPAWTAMSSLGWASKDKFQSAAPWFKKDELLGVLADLISDKDFYWLGRNSAIDSYIRLGANKEDLVKIRETAYKDVKADDSGVDKFVVKKLEEKVAKWDEELKRYGRDK